MYDHDQTQTAARGAVETRDDTILASVGVGDDLTHGAVMPPLYLSSNYSFEGYARPRAYDYSRSGNPTRDQLADALTQLERGAGGQIVSTGMAAVDLVLSLLPPNALVIAPHDCYGGTWRLLTALANKRLIEVQFVDQTNEAKFNNALAFGPKLVWIETPSNPLMRVSDIAKLTAAAHAAGAKVAVDNTFLSPLLQKPLTLGADFAVHSTTKYINGHSDVVGGAVIAKAEEDAQQLKWWANCRGVTAAPFDCWLTLRGLRTLAVRLERQQQSAAILAERLAEAAGVKAVHYPGLTTHPSRAIAARQQAGFGAMLSFELEDRARAPALAESVKRLTLAESLGGIESLICHPATMTHAAMSAEARSQAGITDGLIRISAGLEHVEDLWTDLQAALQTSRQRASAA